MRETSELTAKEIIDNVRDELMRCRELLYDNEEAQESWLIEDIDSSLDRLWDLEEIITTM